MAFIKGNNKILYLYIDPDWVAIGCLTDNSFSEQVDLLDVNIDEWAASVPTNQGYGLTFTGIQDDATPLTYVDIRALKRAKTLVQWKVENVNTLEGESGYGFITDIGEAAPAGDFLTFDGSIVGFGEPGLLVITSDIWSNSEGIIWSDSTEMIFS